MKNLILVVFLFFIYSCGYTSVYKNLKEQNFKITMANVNGDRDINNQLKNQFELYSNNNSDREFKVDIDSKYEKLVIAKDSSGVISDYQLRVNSTFTIYTNNKIEKITFQETINVKKKADTFEQNLYEKNIKRNFASSIREKLISKIVTIK